MAAGGARGRAANLEGLEITTMIHEGVLFSMLALSLYSTNNAAEKACSQEHWQMLLSSMNKEERKRKGGR